MKTILVVLLFIASYTMQAQESNSDKEAIKEVIQTSYVEGLQNEGNLDKIDSGIHPQFKLLGIDKGDEMWELSIGDWKKKTVKKVEDGKLPRKDNLVHVTFENIDITGNAAVAKIGFYVGEKLTYIDYISLYKFESGWLMVNKIYHKL